MLIEIIYNLAMKAYPQLIWLFSPFNKKAKLWVEGRKKWTNQPSLDSEKPLAWFHCASLGEFEQGKPVIEAFRAKYPRYKILLTFFSPSGYEVQKNYVGADYVCYLPSDTPANAQKFIEIFRPTIVFFVKYEFWRNYLTELKKQNIPILAFSVIFRPSQIFFQWYGKFFRKILFNFNHILVQDINSKKLLQNIDFQDISIAGDTRFDRVQAIVENCQSIEIAQRFRGNHEILIIGSAWQEDIDCVFGKNIFPPTLKFIIAPHEIDDKQILAWQKQIPYRSIRFSEAKNDTQLSDYQCLIIDNIGMLSSLYQYADFAFIGGGFDKGLHNILEAATFGMPIFFGNQHYQKFKEANDLILLEGAYAVKNEADFRKKLDALLQNKAQKSRKAEICRKYVQENIGATEKVLAITEKILK
jgi:3-deoxy-D-manno-octulosonic-acid transferase